MVMIIIMMMKNIRIFVFIILCLALSVIRSSSETLTHHDKIGSINWDGKDSRDIKDGAIMVSEFIAINITHYKHASTIIEMRNNVFLAAWVGGDGEGTPSTRIFTSRKSGIYGTWSKPEIVADQSPQPVWNPVLFYNGTTVLLFYKSGPHPNSWSGMMKRSNNEGHTWSPVEIFPGGIVGPAKNKPILVEKKSSNDRWNQNVTLNKLLCPSSLETQFLDSSWIDITDDWGLTWRKAGPISLHYDMVQPTLFFVNEKYRESKMEQDKYQKNDEKEQLGRNIMALIRSDSKRIIVSTSNDYGDTWSKAELTDIPHPHSGIDAVRLRSSEMIYLAYNPSETRRNPLHLAVNVDGDGRKWEDAVVLDSDPNCESFSYPAIIEDSKGMIHVTYSWVCSKQDPNNRIKHVVIDPSKLFP